MLVVPRNAVIAQDEEALFPPAAVKQTLLSSRPPQYPERLSL